MGRSADDRQRPFHRGAVATYLQPSVSSGDEVDESSLGELHTVDPSGALVAENLSGPTWVGSSWADAMPGVTAFEFSSGGEVMFANGGHRPTLGVSCGDGQTDVHVTRGGTALIDPQTSGHVVNLMLDDRNAARHQWVAAHDQRALFAGDSRAAVRQIALPGICASASRTTCLDQPLLILTSAEPGRSWV